MKVTKYCYKYVFKKPDEATIVIDGIDHYLSRAAARAGRMLPQNDTHNLTWHIPEYATSRQHRWWQPALINGMPQQIMRQRHFA